MFYFKDNGDTIEKYYVYYAKELIEKLKKEIIDNCSEIQHKELTSDTEPMVHGNNKSISNFKTIYAGKYNNKDRYFYSYDEHIHPQLVSLINRLLNNDTTSIKEIIDYDTSKDITIDEKIKLITEKFNNIDALSYDEKKSNLKQLEYLLSLKKTTKSQQNISPYYKRLIELIHFLPVDSIKKEELYKLESFIETNIKIDNGSITTSPKKVKTQNRIKSL